jgi:hypothetical protein
MSEGFGANLIGLHVRSPIIMNADVAEIGVERPLHLRPSLLRERLSAVASA